ncbi:putative dual-specificity RNA methyltransferase [Frankliniella fusca]|uniref:Dual-specificity RNA methyltransferase n=1 Tax=Frankliniella fusca TaxID=407009 RepID=A0AAE1H850_9NEOP|nr:putative dual-specificity RNA methyltransferase [Frankliniella fusca]
MRARLKGDFTPEMTLTSEATGSQAPAHRSQARGHRYHRPQGAALHGTPAGANRPGWRNTLLILVLTSFRSPGAKETLTVKSVNRLDDSPLVTVFAMRSTSTLSHIVVEDGALVVPFRRQACGRKVANWVNWTHQSVGTRMEW